LRDGAAERQTKAVEQPYPILEFDPAPQAIVEPGRLIARADAPERAVLCFFNEVIAAVCGNGQGRVVRNLRSDRPQSDL